jgi:YHS domain-containing protein
MTIDPVCGMEVDQMSAEYISEFQDEIYYFCSPGCKIMFDSEPEAYLVQASEDEDMD